MTSTTRIPLIAKAELRNENRTAIVDESSSFTYENLLKASARVASALLENQGDLAL